MELQITVEPQAEAKSTNKGCCIYNVPEKLRQENKEAYTPQVVSIGPLHRDRGHQQAMRWTKNHFCEQFCKRTQSKMDRYLKEAKGWETEARGCYEGIIKMDSDEFVEMMVEDGIFVVEVLLRVSNLVQNEMTENDENELFSNTLLRDDVIHDMMMLENQMPLFIVEKLYKFINIRAEWKDVLFKFAENYFKKGASTIQPEWINRALCEGRHLIEFYHIISVCANPSVDVSGFVVRKYELRRNLNGTSDTKKIELPQRAKALQQFGVEFKPRKYMLPFDLDFKDENLLIPVVTINRWTEVFFTNLIAYEHCLHKEKIITSFVVFMSALLKKPRDVEILIQCGVIDDQTLGDTNDVCLLFHRLYNKSMMNETEFFYGDLCAALNTNNKDFLHICKRKFYQWKEVLDNEYFKSPWSIITVIVAAIALFLTVAQTYYAYKESKNPK